VTVTNALAYYGTELITSVIHHSAWSCPQTLDYAGKAYQGQTLEFIMDIHKLRTKKFYNILTCLCSAQCYKTFFVHNLQMSVIS
jgi:hypothetical protein